MVENTEMQQPPMKYGLKSETLSKINRVFAHYPNIDKVLLYGSRAKGNYRPGSDIDLALVGPRLTLKQLNRVGLELDDLLLPYQFDLALYHHIKTPALLDHINRVKQVFYCRITQA